MHRKHQYRRSLAAGFEPLESRALLAALPGGFEETPVAVGLTRPIAMAVVPDGRIFVAEQNGAIRIVKNDALLPRPFAKLNTNPISESGLIGIAIDPRFATNHYVYVQYTTSPFAGASLHNRISRFTAQGDVVVPGSEKVLFELDAHSSSFHMGGAIHFGGDGKLYFTTGDNGNSDQVQSLNNTFGKVLRINPNGTIPIDNPFYNQTSGKYRAIWATGFRNPYTFAVQPGTGRMFVNDVGRHAFEEINDVRKGANFGWPATEGPTSNPAYKSPIFAYRHDSGEIQGAAIAGGAFYNPAVQQFPERYRGDYFFADFASGHIYVLDVATRQGDVFASGVFYGTQPVDLAVDGSGNLYYLMLGDGNPSGGEIRRISVKDKPPLVKLSGDVRYRENAAPVPIAPTATVSDADTANYAGLKLIVQLTAGGKASDRLAVRDNGYVTRQGTTILVDGVAMGTFSGGVGTAPLVVTFTRGATPGRVASLLRNVTFQNVSDFPGVTRNVSVRLAHGAAATLRVAIQPTNDAPIVANLGGNLGYQRGAAAIIVAGFAKVNDVDSFDFAGGKLTAQIVAGSSSSNRLLVGGLFSIANGKLLRSGVEIGTISGNGIGENKLAFDFNRQASAKLVQELLRSVRFRTISGAAAGNRTIRFAVADGDGGLSSPVQKTVIVQ